jgi:hypothetical protein
VTGREDLELTRRIELGKQRGAVELVDPADARAAADLVAGVMVGALNGLAAVELHEVRDRMLPAFEVQLGRHRLVVHVDQVIA